MAYNKKELARFIAYVATAGCFRAARLFPLGVMYAVAFFLGRTGYALLPHHRKVAFESLNIAFGKEKSPREIRAIARDCLVNIAKSGVEMMKLWDKPQEVIRRVDIIGEEHLKAGLARRKGVILVSAHSGNFPLLMARLIAQGYPVACIMRVMRDARMEKFFAAKREKLGLKTIHTQPRSACVAATLAALRNNELVFIPMDQNFGTAGVFVDFFGRKAATATGPVVLAQRTGAVLLPCFISRHPDNMHTVVFKPPHELISVADAGDPIVENVQRLTEIIEAHIRTSPAEWGWIHRRWKSRIPGSGLNES